VKEFYVPSTEFENPDEPFLYLTPDAYEPLVNPDIFPLRIELKAVLEFRSIQRRPTLSFFSTPSSTPFTVVLYQTDTWYDQVSIRLCSTGWSTFESRDEPFEDSRVYRLQRNVLDYTYMFAYVADHHKVVPTSLHALPCGTKPTQDPRTCVAWYCIPKFSSQHQKLTLSWEPAFEYDDEAELPVAKAITQGTIQCDLMYQQCKKRYRSHAYHVKQDTLWITFFAIESAPPLFRRL
jgi:hypothetical protein